MDAQVLKAAFGDALLWGCGLGLAGVALAALALGFARFPARVRAAVQRYGLSAVLVFGGFAAVATVTGAVTHASKARESATPVGRPAALNACAEETRSVSEERSQSDSERSELPARARENEKKRSRGEGEEWVSTNQHESTRIEIRENPCQFVDKTPTGGEETPCLRCANTSAFSTAGLSVFEDAYENAPGETVARRSTASEAAFSVYGGTKGSTLVDGCG